jgi:glutathione S-transferase
MNDRSPRFDLRAAPLALHGSKVSYFTGKLEAYLRYKEIPFEFHPVTVREMNGWIRRETGAAQIPAVVLPDGRAGTDTTALIAWFESQHAGPAVIPGDPLQAFASRLVEDYADEWMWRPALYYRWAFRPDALLMSRRIVAEFARGIPLPGALLRLAIRLRQRQVNLRGDGVSRRTAPHVEALYRRTLAQLQAILVGRPFLLGERPTLADFGFFASMFRHFGIDPTPAAIMRDQAPAVYEWIARVWNARASRTHGPLVPGVPEDWSPILDEIGSAYLPYLAANAEAWKEQRRRFDVTLQEVAFTGFRVFDYRVWCLEQLRGHYQALPAAARDEARALLERHGAWEPLWRVEALASGHDPEGRAPFGVGLGLFDH